MAMPWKRRALLATPLPAAWMSSVIIHNLYVKFYTDVVGLDTRYVGWVYLAFNIWNVLNDPVFGVLLDKMRYRPGKGKFLLVMRVTIPFLLLGLMAMAWTPSTWSQGAILAVFLLELFIFDVAATLYLISATSYVYLAAPTREDRIDVEVMRSWIGNAISSVATIVATQLLVGDAITERLTLNVLVMGVVLVNGIFYLIGAFALKDPPELYEHGDGGTAHITGSRLRQDLLEILRLRAFWALFGHGLTFLAPMGIYFTAFLFFMDDVIGSTGTQATIADVGSMLIVLALLPLVARMIKRVGSRTALWLATLPYLAGFTALLLLAERWFHVLACYVLIMAGRYMVTISTSTLDAALIDDDERRTGIRKAGTIASVRALLTAPVAGTQMVIYMAILNHGGYISGAAEQTASAQEAIRWATAGVPILFALLGLLPLALLPYSRERERELSLWSEQQRAREGTAVSGPKGSREVNTPSP
ncbi:MFS transporter [Brachybacterium sp. UMB0905]|uniref:MFS transporter n=1 Tax=Brachybacterium sp. UMB0905 TaxID=2069310 RepID=UPI000C7FB9B1|nr:MFS transporter [Brachybacterium sp. UMB0905]PMC75141.1 hypothetical protein CJ197_09055 [Brachybacterium sp. UMB0905]